MMTSKTPPRKNSNEYKLSKRSTADESDNQRLSKTLHDRTNSNEYKKVSKRSTAAGKKDDHRLPKLVINLCHANKKAAVVLGVLEEMFVLFQTSPNAEGGLALTAPEKVLKAMKEWKDHKEIQIYGCGCLGFLSGHSERGRWATIDAGALEAIVETMGRFPKEIRVQSNGCGVLVNLLGPEPTKGLEGITQDLIDPDGHWDLLRLIRDAMDRFRDDVELQVMGCAILYRLSLTLSFHKTMISLGVVTTVGSALEFHLEDARIREYVNVFYQNLFHSKGVLSIPELWQTGYEDCSTD